MQKDLGTYRRSYEKDGLVEADMAADPLEMFRNWFREAEESGGSEEANAMTLATTAADGFPKNRVVLLKRLTPEGFVFFTNYNSEKGQAIAADDRVCLSFYWPVPERQVIVQGRAEKVDEALSDEYFRSRPKGSRLGAIASDQSRVIPTRDVLEEKLRQLEESFRDKEVERPSHWGGYLVRPVTVEFWQGRPNRLHDRLRYRLSGEKDWQLERLAP